jgi:biopolymer transport protein TolR
MTPMRRPRKSINQINVVPYIDVMLVLLVIFMVTAPLITPGEMQLPSVGSRLTTPVAPLEITINADHTLSLRDGAAPPQRMSRDDILARIKNKQANRPEQAVVIFARGTLPYKDVIDVIDLLQTSGVRNVGLMAQPKSG